LRLSSFSYPSLLFDDGEEVGAVGGEAEAAIADWVAGGVKSLVGMGEKVALLVFVGCWIVGGEIRGHGVVEEQIALRHVLAEVALHHAGVDEVFKKAEAPHILSLLGVSDHACEDDVSFGSVSLGVFQAEPSL